MGLHPSELNDEPSEHKPDYTEPIARKGEQQFACILRQRSGVSAGEIDYGLRDCTILGDAEQQEICDVAWMLYESICHQTGKRSVNDKSV